MLNIMTWQGVKLVAFNTECRVVAVNKVSKSVGKMNISR